MQPKEKQPNLETIQRVGIAALKKAYRVHEELGDSGIELLKKNQFGDTALRADVEVEEAVLSVLRDSGLPITVFSEEHGKVQLGEETQYTGVLDGIDGSSWYKSERGKGRYGTMFAIFAGKDPTYGDYQFSGIMEHATKRLFYAVKGKGAFIMDVQTGAIIPIHTAQATALDKGTRVHIDEYWEINRQTFLSKLQGYNVQKYNRCSSVHYANVAMGQADLALECTRKGNLEIAAAHGLIVEAGGDMISLDGDKVADKKFLEFAQDTHAPIITAATRELAISTMAFLKAS